MIERYQSDSPQARADGNAAVLLGNDPGAGGLGLCDQRPTHAAYMASNTVGM